MLLRILFLVLFLTIVTTVDAFAANHHGTLVNWRPWQPQVFSQAEQQGKLVLLDLAAEWCHWCHVMDAKTYSDASVADYIHEHYLPVRVDHDANPALADRYRAYGWPATVVLNPRGEDVVKRAGYIAPDNMLRLLRAIVADPTPERQARLPAVKSSNKTLLGEDLREPLRSRHLRTVDRKVGGLVGPQKFIDRNKLEYSLWAASRGDDGEAVIAKQTLNQAMRLIDPEWGGMYQYSTGYDWRTPHYEKIMMTQAGAIRLYAQAYLLYNDDKYLQAANRVADYLSAFITAPDGRFYTSQDADLVAGEKSGDFWALSSEQRYQRGIPKVDTNIYARENGMAIAALLQLYQASNDEDHRRRALVALEGINKSHRRPSGHYYHKPSDAAAYLNDDSEMLNALILAYKVTAQPRWLEMAIITADAIVADFSRPQGGYWGTPPDQSLPAAMQPRPQLDNNIDVARRLNMLFHYSGLERLKTAAEHAMKFLAHRDNALSRIEETGLLLLDYELSNKPPHFTIVADMTDDRTDKLATVNSLYRVALEQPGWYSRVEWWRPNIGRLANHDVEYPNFGQPAGFYCADGLCSAPSFNADEYRGRLQNRPQ